MLHKKTINDIDLKNKQVLLRADYNVPINNGKILSNYRITQSIPTIEALQKEGCKIVIISHLGRPKGEVKSEFSLKPIAKELEKLLGKKVGFVPECVGQEVEDATEKMESGEILLLENLRFHKEEKDNDIEFAEQLAKCSRAEVLVQDGFGVVHRRHASTDSLAKQLMGVAGLLLNKEYDSITKSVKDPSRPMMAIIGGAKIADKIDILHRFIEIADVVAIGGAMSNTFLKAQGIDVGDSLVDEDELDIAHDLMNKARQQAALRKFIFYIPQDGVVSSKMDKKTTTRIVDWDAHVIAEIEAYPGKPKPSSSKVAAHEMILDIGPFSGAFISGAMQMCETVVWNGTMGVSEIDPVHGTTGPFAQGTDLIIDSLVGKYGHRPFSLIGGGDTAGYLEHKGMTDMFNFVSTGGGATLELMAGKKLPGIEVLWDK